MRAHFFQKFFLFLLVRNAELLENLIKSYCIGPHFNVVNGLTVLGMSCWFCSWVSQWGWGNCCDIPELRNCASVVHQLCSLHKQIIKRWAGLQCVLDKLISLLHGHCCVFSPQPNGISYVHQLWWLHKQMIKKWAGLQCVLDKLISLLHGHCCVFLPQPHGISYVHQLWSLHKQIIKRWAGLQCVLDKLISLKELSKDELASIDKLISLLHEHCCVFFCPNPMASVMCISYGHSINKLSKDELASSVY